MKEKLSCIQATGTWTCSRPCEFSDESAGCLGWYRPGRTQQRHRRTALGWRKSEQVGAETSNLFTSTSWRNQSCSSGTPNICQCFLFRPQRQVWGWRNKTGLIFHALQQVQYTGARTHFQGHDTPYIVGGLLIFPVVLSNLRLVEDAIAFGVGVVPGNTRGGGDGWRRGTATHAGN